MSKLRVLICDDSPTVRTLLREVFDADSQFETVGEAVDGRSVVELAAKLRPDIITMDLQLPHQDGLSATREIMASTPTRIVIVSSAARPNGDNAELAGAALSSGALCVLSRPSGPSAPDFTQSTESFLRNVRAMSEVRVVRRWRSGRVEPVPKAAGLAPNTKIVAIGCSTGGPPVLQTILDSLGPHFPLPILVVQHIAVGFCEGLCRWLTTSSKLDVRLAVQGEPLKGGRVYVAPDHRHLGCESGRIDLSDDPPIGPFKPSANYLFRSVAENFGPSAIGIILTGMGNDGLTGLTELKRRGGYVVAQNQATSAVYGMPRVVIEAGIADMVATPDEVAQFLVNLDSRLVASR